jgi:putative transposase
LRTYARKYMPVNTYAEPNQTYTQYKDKTLTPWLYDCPSQILRNGTVNWYNTYRHFMKEICGRPKHKRKSHQGSVHLTRELFKFYQEGDKWVLEIGTKTKRLGRLAVTFHRDVEPPKSLYTKRNHNRWSVSFCYDDDVVSDYVREDHFKHLQGESRESLEAKVEGIDRGVKRPVQFGKTALNYTPQQRKKLTGHERHLRQLQRKLARQTAHSKRRAKTGARIARKKTGKRIFAMTSATRPVIQWSIATSPYWYLRT